MLCDRLWIWRLCGGIPGAFVGVLLRVFWMCRDVAFGIGIVDWVVVLMTCGFVCCYCWVYSNVPAICFSFDGSAVGFGFWCFGGFMHLWATGGLCDECLVALLGCILLCFYLKG